MKIMDQILSVYYAWHRFEAGNQVDIIDFDLLGIGESFKKTYRNRDEVKQDVIALMETYDRQTDKNAFVAEKLNAAFHFLCALMGENLQFHDYVAATMGVQPAPIPEKRLRAEKAKAKDGMDRLGYGFSADEFKRLERETIYTEKTEIIDSFRAAEEKAVPLVLGWLGLDIDPDYSIGFDKTDAFWMNFINTDEHGNIRLRFNLHDSVRKKWRKGAPEFYALHEICCHALQSLNWKKRLRQGNIDRISGLTSVFTPEQFISEGIAQTLYYFLPENPLSDHGELYLHANNLYHMLLNNAHIMVNGNQSFEDAFEYISNYLPNLDADFMKKDLHNRANDPLLRTYQYIYGIASYYHQEIAAGLDDKGKRDYVVDIFHNVYSPGEIFSKYKIDLL
ncbi:MAG: hypothetical protein HKM93_18925 [Desulfobacteraceae bacterium]|nr:hypothetical protein [Desulfobacteraceae bacterium]